MAYTPTRGADRVNGWWEEIHGTRARYRKGCRCDSCRTAEREYRAEYRARHRTGVTPPKIDGVTPDEWVRWMAGTEVA